MTEAHSEGQGRRWRAMVPAGSCGYLSEQLRPATRFLPRRRRVQGDLPREPGPARPVQAAHRFARRGFRQSNARSGPLTIEPALAKQVKKAYSGHMLMFSLHHSS